MKAPTFLLLRCSENILTFLSFNFSEERKTRRLSFPIPEKKWPRRKQQSGEEINEGAPLSPIATGIPSYSRLFPTFPSPLAHLSLFLSSFLTREKGDNELRLEIARVSSQVRGSDTKSEVES